MVYIVRARVSHAYSTYVTFADGSLLYASTVVDARGVEAAGPAVDARSRPPLASWSATAERLEHRPPTTGWW